MCRFYLGFILCAFSSLVLSSPAPRAATTNCYPLIAGSQQAHFPSANLPCVAVPENSVTQGNLKVSTYHWVKGPDTAVVYGEKAQLHSKSINDGIQKAVKAYGGFLKEAPLSTNLVFIPAASLPDGWGDTWMQKGTTVAQRKFSVLIANFRDGFQPDYNKWARTTAHELYHCVLMSTNAQDAQAAHPWNQWWDEGGPSFFASALFPEPLDPTLKIYSDPDHPDLNIQGWFQTYKPTESLYNQGYSAELFFLDMYTRPTQSRQDLANIHSFLSQQDMSSTEQAERARVAGDGFTPDQFREFAQRFADGVIKLRRDADVKAAVFPVYKQGYQESKTVKLGANAAPATWTASKLVSFGFMRLDLSLQAPDTKNQVTYAISAASQGAGTTIFYRAKTAKKWTKLDAGTSKKVTVGCGSGPQDYVLLFVSTDGTDPPKPVLSVARQSSKKCPCTSARRSLLSLRQESCESEGACLDGTWKLDLDSLKAAIQAALAKSSADATVTNLKLGGSSTFVYDEAASTASMSFDHTTISYDGSASGYEVHIDIDINGKAQGPVAMTGDDSFHWTDITGSGEYNTATILKGLGDDTPIEVDMPLTAVYTADVVVKYTCSGDKLTLEGLENGLYVWTYSYTRSGGTA
ncbi:hypothetical protein CLCR_01120 [Cladophialophora carrionii]|uniref:Uncharacterized protein n=1 Tax=Cladophialophora carrionii TaxID=86049 RepID=A0A1C1CCX1_9EURO|nr:hypothetical protein CLCR_01120 [Cladophialophora carrionii]